MAAGARLPRRAGPAPERLGVLGEHERGVVGGIEVVAEALGLLARQRVPVEVALRPHGSLERLEIRDDVHDLRGRQDPGGAPRRHGGAGEHGARVVELLIEVRVGKPAVAERGEIGAHAARRPHVVARHQVTTRARPFRAREEEPPSLGRIARHARGHRGAPDPRLRARVAVRVGAERAEVARRPTLVAERDAPAVGPDANVAASLGDRAGGPGGEAVVVGEIGGGAGTAERQRGEREGGQRARPDGRHPLSLRRT